MGFLTNVAQVALAIGGCVVVSSAATLDLAPSSQVSGTGSAVDIALVISGLGDFTSPSLGTYDVTIGFDPTVLTLHNVIFGDPVLGDQLDLFGLGDIQNSTPGMGTLELFELSLESPGDLVALQPGRFTLATITFDTVASVNGQLTLNINTLGDENGNSLLATPEPSSSALLLFCATVAFGLFGLRRWRESPIYKIIYSGIGG